VIWFFVGVIVAVVAALPFVFEAQRRVVDVPMRTRAKGAFAQLSAGMTHYRWHGPRGGPVIVAVHGLTTPAIVWNGMIPLLTAQGYRVLSYDLYGRGFSDAPSGAQDIAFFTQQLVDLLADQGVTGPVTLMGYSMGGSIVTAYAAAHADRVSRVLLVAAAGMDTHTPLFDRLCRAIPGLGDWMHASFAAGRVRRAAIASPKPNDIAGMQVFQLARRGYLPAVLASQRGALSERQSQAHRRLGRLSIPVVAVWGRLDKTIPLSAMGKLSTWNRDVRHEEVMGAGHGLPYSHPEATVRALLDV
jgi:pimeloyl-ACP methyl ester carboxylesterase